MQTNTARGDYAYFFGLGLLVSGAAWIIACIGFMVHYFPEHGGGAVVMFVLAAQLGVFLIHIGRRMTRAVHNGSH